VTPVRAPALSETSAALSLLFILLIPCAAAGLALINAGLGRFRNAAHSMLSALGVIATAALVYFAIGAAWQGSAGQPAFALHVAGQDWNWIGAGRFFLRGLELGGWSSLPMLFGLMGVGLAAISRKLSAIYVLMILIRSIKVAHFPVLGFVHRQTILCPWRAFVPQTDNLPRPS